MKGNSPIGHQDEDVDEDEQIKPLNQEATSPTVQPTGMHTTQLSNQCVCGFFVFVFLFFCFLQEHPHGKTVSHFPAKSMLLRDDQVDVYRLIG